MSPKQHPLEKYADERGIALTDEERRQLRAPARKGYVSRAVAPSVDSDAVLAGDVPWYYSDNIHPDFEEEAARKREGRDVVIRDKAELEERFLEEQRAELEPIVRRSPQERLNEMTKVLLDEYRRTGVIAESILRKIGNIYWAHGQPVSAEDLRAIAAHYLEQATRMGHANDPSIKHDIRTKGVGNE